MKLKLHVSFGQTLTEMKQNDRNRDEVGKTWYMVQSTFWGESSPHISSNN